MMSPALNLNDFRNLSLTICQGSGTISRLYKSSPLHQNKTQVTDCPTSPPDESRALATAKAPTVLYEECEGHQRQQRSSAMKVLTGNNSNKRKRRFRSVRFATSSAFDRKEVEHQKKRKERVNRKEFDSSDSILWWTPEELRDIQQSCKSTVDRLESGLRLESVSLPSSPNQDNDLSSLEHYLSRNRKRRKVVRYQMNETIRAIAEFESATKMKTPPEMFSQLLQVYSKPPVAAAIKRALRSASPCASLHNSS